MRRLLTLTAGVLCLTGCAGYRLIVYNGTDGKIHETTVILADGRSFRFGVMGPTGNAGMSTIEGPLGNEATLEWVDAQGRINARSAVISCGVRDDSVIFVLGSNNTVTVRCGRGLFSYRNPTQKGTDGPPSMR